MLDIVQDKIRIRTMASDDAVVLLKWMTDMRVLEFYEGRDKRYTPELIQEDFFEDEYSGSPLPDRKQF